MAKSVDVLKRLVRLMQAQKVKETDMHAILNGAIVNGGWTYQDGSIKNNATGRVETLSPDRIVSFVWPVPAKKAPAKKPFSLE